MSAPNMVEEALALAARGFRVIPIHTPRPDGCSCERAAECGGSTGKHPRVGEWQKEATTDTAIIARWWRSWPDANIGLVMGGESRLVAVDIDGPGGRATLARLEGEHGALPATLTSRSGRVDGGEHRFFRVPPELDIRAIKNRAGKTGGPMPKVDIRAEAGQVVAPPSLHASGNRYAWQDREMSIAELPEWLYRLATWEPPPPPVAAPPSYREPSGRMSPLERARTYLTRIPGAVSGQGGHAHTLLAAAHLVKGFRLDPGTAMLLLREWNLTCDPPWSERELRHKVDEAPKATVVEWSVHLQDDWTPPVRSVPVRARDTAPEELSPEEFEAEQAWRDEEDAPRPPVPAIVQPQQEKPKEPSWKRLGVRTVYEVLHGVYNRVIAPESRVFVSTGNAEIDALIGGYRPGRVTVLGASTSWGKSSFSIMGFDEGTRAGKRVLIVSGEDGEDLYGKRLAARRANLNAFRLRDHDLSEREKNDLLYVAEKAEHVPFFIDGVGKSAEHLAKMIEELCREEPYDHVIVDYIQAFRCDARKQDRRNEVTHIARCFVDAIKRANASGLILSQIKRLEDGKIPTRHDLKESGDVENMAEHVLMGYVEKIDEHTRQRLLIVDKNKDGPLSADPVALEFDERTASFVTRRPVPRSTEDIAS